MEVEAKYALRDADTYDQLVALTTLGGCELRPAAAKQFTDHYYDTAARALFAAGYALRLRDAGDHWRATLKGLGAAEGALHQREEVEADIAPGALPAEWPAGPARDLALRLAGDAPLAELFSLRQKRARRLAYPGARLVAASRARHLGRRIRSMLTWRCLRPGTDSKPPGTTPDRRLSLSNAGRGADNCRRPQPVSAQKMLPPR